MVGFSKKSHILLFLKNSVFAKKFLAQFSNKQCFHNGSVSGSGTGPVDPGSRGPALPDPETFPYEWLGVRQYISMSCVSCM